MMKTRKEKQKEQKEHKEISTEEKTITHEIQTNNFTLQKYLNHIKNGDQSKIDLSEIEIPAYQLNTVSVKPYTIKNSLAATARIYPTLTALPGNRFAIAFNGKIEIWQHDGTFVRVIGDGTGRICSLNVTSQGFLLSGYRENKTAKEDIILWNPNNGEQIGRFSANYKHFVTAVMALWDDRTIMSSQGSIRNEPQAEEGYIQLWSRTSGKNIKQFQAHDQRIVCAKLLDETRWATGSFDKTVKIWKGDFSRPEAVFKADAQIFDIIPLIGHGPKLAIFAASGKITIYNYESKKVERTLIHADLSEGLESFYSTDLYMQCRELGNNSDCEEHAYFFKPSLNLLPDGRLVSSHREKIKVWDALLDKDRPAYEFDAMKGMMGLAVLENGNMVTVDERGRFTILSSTMRPLKMNDIRLLIDALESSYYITRINLQYVQLLETDIDSFINLLVRNQVLKKLTILSRIITERGKQILADAMTKRKEIKEVTVKINQWRIRKKDGCVRIDRLGIDINAERPRKLNPEKVEKLLIEHTQQIIDIKERLNANQAILSIMQARVDLLDEKLSSIDENFFNVIKQHSKELTAVIMREKMIKETNDEREYILKERNMADYYFAFSRQLTSVWIACIAIDSDMVENSSSTKVSKVPKVLDKLSGYVAFPGISLLTEILGMAFDKYAEKQKKEVVNRIVKFFNGLEEGYRILELYARKLTLAQHDRLERISKEKAIGWFAQLREKAEILKRWATADDIDTAVKDLAVEQAKKILAGIAKGELTFEHRDIRHIKNHLRGQAPSLSRQGSLSFKQRQLQANGVFGKKVAKVDEKPHHSKDSSSDSDSSQKPQEENLDEIDKPPKSCCLIM